MNIYLSSQERNFKSYLNFLKHRKIIPYDKSKLKRKESEIHIESNSDIKNLNLNFFYNYNIFPKNIMAFLTEWRVENRNMRVGDTIVQQIHVPPSELFSIKLICGVRIREIISEPNRQGFSYETLMGHTERGISTFTFEHQDNTILFRIQTFSEPSSLLTRLTRFIADGYQAFCTNQALLSVKNSCSSLT